MEMEVPEWEDAESEDLEDPKPKGNAAASAEASTKAEKVSSAEDLKVESLISGDPTPALKTKLQQQQKKKKRRKKKLGKGEKEAVHSSFGPMSAPGDRTTETSNDLEIPFQKHSQGEKRLNISNAHTPLRTQKKKKSLLDKFQSKLSGGKFRWLNETLYSCSSENAKKLYTDDPLLYDVYHQGYREQVSRWPVNPLDLIIDKVGRLPQSYVVADLGCGDARLSASVSQKVYSFDLVSHSEDVVACNIAELPLPDKCVDVVVICLALMGNDYFKFLSEARRILKKNGQLLIAEVKSRFAGSSLSAFLSAMEESSFESTLRDDSNSHFILLYYKKSKKAKNAFASDKQWPPLKICTYKKR